MASLPCFRLAFRDALRFSPAFPPNNPSRAARCLSGWGKPLLAARRPRRRMEGTEAASSRGDAPPELARQEEVGGPDSKSPPVLKTQPAGPLVHKFWHQFRKQSAPPTSVEFTNLRNDDFPRKKKRVPPNPCSVQRSEGSEILFGVAPCGLALRRSRRNFFQLFLKQSGDGPSPALMEFSRQAHDRRIPMKWVGRAVLDALCRGGVHQGVCLEATPLQPVGWREGPPLEVEGVPNAVEKGSQLLWLVLERILDPMNLGAILRSAHFLGVDRILMSQKNRSVLPENYLFIYSIYIY